MTSLPTTLVASYLAIAVQTLTGLIFIPFLVSEDGVGLAGFALIATVQASAGLVTFLFDGYRQYAARAVALALQAGDGNALSSIWYFSLFCTTAVVGIWAMVWPSLARAIGVHTNDVVLAGVLAAACVVIEQLSYVLECYQHAAKQSWLPSGLGALDSLFRACGTVILFDTFSASLSLFFLAALGGQSVKLVVLLWLSPMEMRVPSGQWGERMISECTACRESLPLALNGIAPFVVFRGGVILSNAMLTGVQAGVLAILLVTVRTYVNQGLFSVLRPMLIPRLALVDIYDCTSASFRKLIAYLDLFQVFTLLVGVLAVVSTPWWFSLWLGRSVEDYVGLAQVAVATYFLEIAYGVQYSCLVAHNHGRTLALFTGFLAVMTLVSTAVGTYYFPTAAVCAGPVLAYVLSYVVAVRLQFGTYVDYSLRQSDVCTGLFVVALGAGIGMGVMSGGASLVPALLAGALFVGLSQVLGLRISMAQHVRLWKREAVDVSS